MLEGPAQKSKKTQSCHLPNLQGTRRAVWELDAWGFFGHWSLGVGASASDGHAPNLSNIFAFACMRRMRYFASKTLSDPIFAPVSVNRSNLSEPESAECRSTGCGCPEWPFTAHAVEW